MPRFSAPRRVRVQREARRRGCSVEGIGPGSADPRQGVILEFLQNALAAEHRLQDHLRPAWLDQLVANIRAGDLSVQNTAPWDPKTWPREAKGVGFMEAPRGALCHYIVIKDDKIDNDQAVVPSTWNAGPHDAAGEGLTHIKVR